ncbi:MAG: hypothetical protein RMJ51_03745 [Candidatus Calescibacterium sp.]|nr:hypothetical protein [Candidatus Calescibacterium sp.]MCX7971732.1 hypothetical protein [bacterium]MDW8195338.1 hypothetical protein [Candidatus Calescibacterium sp.]
MPKKKYVVVVTEINPTWVKLTFEDGDFITIPTRKLPEKIHVGQMIELSIKTTTILTILKEIENITKRDIKDLKGEINGSVIKDK